MSEEKDITVRGFVFGIAKLALAILLAFQFNVWFTTHYPMNFGFKTNHWSEIDLPMIATYSWVLGFFSLLVSSKTFRYVLLSMMMMILLILWNFRSLVLLVLAFAFLRPLV